LPRRGRADFGSTILSIATPKGLVTNEVGALCKLASVSAIRRAQERSLFVDINANQEGLNTSYLAKMQSKLTPEQLEIKIISTRGSQKINGRFCLKTLKLTGQASEML
jgi:hypothetical protein